MDVFSFSTLSLIRGGGGEEKKLVHCDKYQI